MGEGARGKGFSKQHSSSNSRFGEIITTKPPIMTKKRKNTDLQAEDILYNKRSRLSQADGSDDSPSAAQSKIDPIYGQRGAFPGLDDSRGEDDLFYGPASDGLEYLRMVR